MKAFGEIKKQIGFTLIELSIVLVIIGLIVGGVLEGQDLIKASEIRATIGQYEKYNASINTFRGKYNGLPGDLLAASSTSFGLDPASGAHAGTTGRGDGNGRITDINSTNYNLPVGEPLFFWQQLTASNLIDGSFGANLTSDGLQPSFQPAAADAYLPKAKSGTAGYWMVGSSSGVNYYAVARVTAVSRQPTTYATAVGGPFAPIDAFNIDSKIDDGLPDTGNIQTRGHATMATNADTLFSALSSGARPVWTTATVASAAAGDCVTGGSAATDTANIYATGATPGNTPACSLRMRFN